MGEAARPGVSRRALLAASVGALALPSAACGIRLEDDAPRVPLVPTRTPIPLESELVALTGGTLALAVLAGTVPGALAASLATIHRRQHTVLRTTLLRGQVPLSLVDGPAASPSASSESPSGSPDPATSATGTPAPSASPTASTVESLASAEGESAVRAAEFAGAEPDLLATLASLHAQRFAAGTLLSGTAPTVAGAAVAGDAVEAMAASTSAAIYLFEVVSARTSGRVRSRADTTLRVLRSVRADQVAGGASLGSTLGQPLPFPVTTTADAARLAREAMLALRSGYGEHLAALAATGATPGAAAVSGVDAGTAGDLAGGAAPGDAAGAGLAAATRWLGAVEVQANRWGVALAPFPGLT
ncbi:MAG TPA: hypothetical protein PLU20_02460 [Ornithinibacter sp.]|nr:hypothetical protein [Ornithinibacter sp.]